MSIRPIFSLPATLVLLSSRLPACGAPASAPAYQPQILKAGPAPPHLVVLDLKADKAGGEERDYAHPS
jgi:hypothetical protein